MDWQKLINQFLPINSEDLEPFAVSREVAQAVATFNRALTNLKSQNGDIALIALRKLAATYPDFSHAVLLYGLSLALYKQPEEARSQIVQAIETGLPETYLSQAEKSLAQLDLLLEQRRQAQTSGTRQPAERPAPNGVPGAAPVLEKSGRRARVRMASDKERQDVIRRGEFAKEEETNVKVGREPVEYLRIAIPVAAIVIVAGLLLFFGIRTVSGLTEANRLQRMNAERLAWLVDRLEVMAEIDTAVSNLLEDYETAFTTIETTDAPTFEPTTEGPSETSPSQSSPNETTASTTAPTASPTSSTTSSESTISADAQALTEAGSKYTQAVSLAGSDLRGAGDLLLSARSLLAGIPGTTTAPQLTGDAATLSSSVESLIDEIGPDAAEENRVLGMEQFHIPDYQAALGYFLAGYQLYPRAYGGGVAYYCGRCYQEMGEKEAAKTYYDFVIKNYPDREIGDSARARLREMGY